MHTIMFLAEHIYSMSIFLHDIHNFLLLPMLNFHFTSAMFFPLWTGSYLHVHVQGHSGKMKSLKQTLMKQCNECHIAKRCWIRWAAVSVCESYPMEKILCRNNSSSICSHRSVDGWNHSSSIRNSQCCQRLAEFSRICHVLNYLE